MLELADVVERLKGSQCKTRTFVEALWTHRPWHSLRRAVPRVPTASATEHNDRRDGRKQREGIGRLTTVATASSSRPHGTLSFSPCPAASIWTVCHRCGSTLVAVCRTLTADISPN